MGLNSWQISIQEEITMIKSASHQERARLRLSRTPEFYHQFMAGYVASGLTVGQYCRKHQVGESTFHKYRRRPKARAPKSPAKAKAPRMVRVLPAPTSPESTHSVEVQLPSGTVLRLSHIDAQILAVLHPLLTGALK